MVTAPETMEQWRNFFNAAGADIFQVVERAILVAALDCPDEFKSRRDEIAEKLFTCFIGSSSCGTSGNIQEKKESKKQGSGKTMEAQLKLKEEFFDHNEVFDFFSWVLHSDVEMVREEVLRIQKVISNHKESETLLFQSLKMLQLIMITEEILQKTEIERTVGALEEHESNRIRHLAQALIRDWRKLAKKQLIKKSRIEDNLLDAKSISIVHQEHILDCPPMEECAISAIKDAHFDLKNFFADINVDDDGNIEEQDAGAEQNIVKCDNKSEIEEDKRINEGMEESMVDQAKPKEAPSIEQNKPKYEKDLPTSELIAIAKRKLKDAYKEVEEAKKRRKIKLLRMDELPKLDNYQMLQLKKSTSNMRFRRQSRQYMF